MRNNTDIFTKDMARRIYSDLKENNIGRLPFADFKLDYTLSKRGDNNNPLEVDIEIIDENGDKSSSYYMKFNNGFSDFRVIQGNRIIKR